MVFNSIESDDVYTGFYKNEDLVNYFQYSRSEIIPQGE